MKAYLYILLLAFIVASCNNENDLIGKWDRTKLITEEEIPLEIITLELGQHPIGKNLSLEIENDSLTMKQESISRTFAYEVQNDTIFFPSSDGFRFYWRIISKTNNSLEIERSLAGIDPVYMKMKFVKL